MFRVHNEFHFSRAMYSDRENTLDWNSLLYFSKPHRPKRTRLISKIATFSIKKKKNGFITHLNSFFNLFNLCLQSGCFRLPLLIKAIRGILNFEDIFRYFFYDIRNGTFTEIYGNLTMLLGKCSGSKNSLPHFILWLSGYTKASYGWTIAIRIRYFHYSYPICSQPFYSLPMP